jgi:DNA-binding winged helix-turn-helix (wHTH) protein
LDNIFRFSGFEADRERYQLWCGTGPIKLERIPIELLFLLLENCGKLVSRAQIVSKLWGDDVFLDTERSINTAVRKIRKALKDDPRHPQFIETVVGQGYRFVAPLAPKNELQVSHLESQSGVPASGDGTDKKSNEVRLRGFLVETTAGAPVLTCDIYVNNLALGRLPLLDLELPMGATLPVKPEGRLPLKLHGVRVTQTAQVLQILHALSISVLQNGLRSRVPDSFNLSAESHGKQFSQFATEGLNHTGDPALHSEPTAS